MDWFLYNMELRHERLKLSGESTNTHALNEVNTSTHMELYFDNLL